MTDIVYNKNGIPFDIDAIATDLNGKADVDLSNINPTQNVKNTIVGWGMPDYSAGVTVSTTPFIAPYDGVIGFYQTAEVNDELSINVNGTTIVRKINAGYSGLGFSGTILVSKNDTISVNSLAKISTMFFPLKGAN